ncbi:unnamed protein product [Vicia faba]|uniref:Uncharacterized protein n=1 Tax=Vicia faba TaxID=3906 RepID=A0AAV0ZH37_VICFA|nr:unnamed protein product [Vicia faba]
MFHHPAPEIYHDHRPCFTIPRQRSTMTIPATPYCKQMHTVAPLLSFQFSLSFPDKMSLIVVEFVVFLYAHQVFDERLFLEAPCLRNGWFSCVLEASVLACFSPTGEFQERSTFLFIQPFVYRCPSTILQSEKPEAYKKNRYNYVQE